VHQPPQTYQKRGYAALIKAAITICKEELISLLLFWCGGIVFSQTLGKLV
jgi:hypothetical protein